MLYKETTLISWRRTSRRRRRQANEEDKEEGARNKWKWSSIAAHARTRRPGARVEVPPQCGVAGTRGRKPWSGGGGEAARDWRISGDDLLTEPGLCRPDKYCPYSRITWDALDIAVYNGDKRQVISSLMANIATSFWTFQSRHEDKKKKKTMN